MNNIQKEIVIVDLLLLDATKTFDRVAYVKLFNILRDREGCPVVLILIMNMYTNQEIQINRIICYLQNVKSVMVYIKVAAYLLAYLVFI